MAVAAIGDRVVPASFWSGHAFAGLHPGAKVLVLYLIAVADRDGIAPLDAGHIVEHARPTTGLADPWPSIHRELERLRGFGLVGAYRVGADWFAWLPDVPTTQPSRGALRVVVRPDLPAPPRDLVLEILAARGVRDPDDAAGREACPRAWGRTRAASGIPDEDVRVVFEAWRARQADPAACGLTPASQRTIRGALREGSAEDLSGLIEWAHDADDHAAAFLRGEGRATRSYLGLDNLLRPEKIQGRLALVEEWHRRGSPRHAAASDSDGSEDASLGWTAHLRRGPDAAPGGVVDGGAPRPEPGRRRISAAERWRMRDRAKDDA